MPKLENGRIIEMLANILGIVNRLNCSQSYGVTINFFSDRILEYVNDTFTDTKDKLYFIADYISTLCKHQADVFRTLLDNSSKKN